MESDTNKLKQSFATKQMKQTDEQEIAFRNHIFGPNLIYKKLTC